jgi:acyl-CoA reductase-like NAD-dependent aldehyde dehydrogenase
MRAYVHEKQAGPLVEELTALARSVKVGNGMEGGAQIGPINNEPQFRRVIELVEGKTTKRTCVGDAPTAFSMRRHSPNTSPDTLPKKSPKPWRRPDRCRA